MSTLGITSNTHLMTHHHNAHNENTTTTTTTPSPSQSSSILQRIRALGEAGIKEATFVKKRIPPYAAVGGIVTVPTNENESNNSLYQNVNTYSATGSNNSSNGTTKIYQNPSSPNKSSQHYEPQQQQQPVSPVEYHIITNKKRVNDEENANNNLPTSYSRYFDQEILKKQQTNNYNSSSSNTSSLERPAVAKSPSPLPPYNAFANEIAHGFKNLKKTNNTKPNEQPFHSIEHHHQQEPDYSLNSLVVKQSHENNSANYDEQHQHQDNIPISIPIKPFVHRDSIDIGKSVGGGGGGGGTSIIHIDHDASTTARPDSSASSINSLNSSLNLPVNNINTNNINNPRLSAASFDGADWQQQASHLKRGSSSSYSNLLPMMMNSQENLKRIVAESMVATNGDRAENLNINYPFNRTLLNANSLMELSTKSSVSSSHSQHVRSMYQETNTNQQHVHHQPLHNRSDLFNNTTSNMSSPPSVEFIKNPMRSSFENLSESTNNTNSQSQLVSKDIVCL